VQNPREAFRWRRCSPEAYFGGLVIAILAGAWLMRKYALPPLATFVFGPGLALGQAIGRLGCFAAGCWGVKCDRAWAVSSPATTRTRSPAFRSTSNHPTQLYEAAC
jgi:phosphatidylglycerol:prolipoprotein diacylglycerol transferase